jgi:hypothetical protein
MGWQPSRSLTDRTEAERAFQLAERLGGVNAAARELGTSWHGCASLPATRPGACSSTIPRPSASGRSRPLASAPAAGHPAPGPGVCGPQPAARPARERSPAKLFQGARREEQHVTLGANVVVDLNSEPCPPATTPSVCRWV